MFGAETSAVTKGVTIGAGATTIYFGTIEAGVNGIGVKNVGNVANIGVTIVIINGSSLAEKIKGGRSKASLFLYFLIDFLQGALVLISRR